MCTDRTFHLRLAVLASIYILKPVGALNEHLCTEDDYTNDLPIFIEKRTICNYESSPVPVYRIKTMPATDYETKFCLKGQSLPFNVGFEQLSLSKLSLELLTD